MNPIKRWYLGNELLVIDQKLLRIDTLINIKYEHESKMKNAKISKKYHEWIYNKACLELETLQSLQPGLLDRRRKIKEEIGND